MTWTVGTRPSNQSLERSAGTPEPADPAAYYCVTPGEGDDGGPEYFPGTLKGLCDAMARAGWLSSGHGTQKVLCTRAQARLALPACQDKPVRRFRGGREIWSAAGNSGRPDDSPPVPALRLDLRGM